MSTARARRYSPIFSATVTPDSVEPLTTSGGAAYTRMTGATIHRNGRPDQIRTVLAFGRPNNEVQHLLAPGKPVELAVQFDGGSLKVIGLPRAKGDEDTRDIAANDEGLGGMTLADAVTRLPQPGRPYVETLTEQLNAVLWLCEVHEDLIPGIITEMLTGESESPAEDGDCDSPLLSDEQLMAYAGHIIMPLVNAGIDHAQAARITDLILELPGAQYLNDMRTLREQGTVREFLAAA